MKTDLKCKTYVVHVLQYKVLVVMRGEIGFLGLHSKNQFITQTRTETVDRPWSFEQFSQTNIEKGLCAEYPGLQLQRHQA